MPDAYLLDSCMVRYLFDDTPASKADARTLRFRARLETLADAPLLICAVTLGEVEYGLRASEGLAEDKQQKVRAALGRFPRAIALSAETACPCYAQARADLFRRYAPHGKRQKRSKRILIDELADPTSAKQLTIQENDLWIACVAMQYNLVLVSDDDDMQRIKGVCHSLRVENWLE